MSLMPEREREQLGQNGRRYFLQEFERDRLLLRLDSWMKELTGLSLPSDCEQTQDRYSRPTTAVPFI